MSSGAEPQDDLERMLEASRELRQHYRAISREEPSALIDEAIRAHARRAVRSRPRLAGSPFASSWRVPLSIAAVLVLSATLTVMVVQRERDLPSADDVPERKSVPATASRADQPVQEQTKPYADADEHAPARRDEMSPPAERQIQRPRSQTDLFKAPARAPATKEAPAPAAAKKAEPFPAAPAQPQAPAPQVAPAPAPEPQASTPRAPAPAQESDGAQSDVAGGLRLQRGLTQPAPRSEIESSRANAAAAQPPAELEKGAKSREEKATPEKQQTPAAAAQPPSSPSQSSEATWESSPQSWLKHIETLVGENRMTEARESLKAFRQRYPSYPLPDEFPLREP